MSPAVNPLSARRILRDVLDAALDLDSPVTLGPPADRHYGRSKIVFIGDIDADQDWATVGPADRPGSRRWRFAVGGTLSIFVLDSEGRKAGRPTGDLVAEAAEQLVSEIDDAISTAPLSVWGTAGLHQVPILTGIQSADGVGPLPYNADRVSGWGEDFLFRVSMVGQIRKATP